MTDQPNDPNQPLDRRRWTRIPVPPGLFESLISIARDNDLNERTLYRLLYEAVKQAYPDDWQRHLSTFQKNGWLNWLDWKDPD